jgi:hypothetical protein
MLLSALALQKPAGQGAGRFYLVQDHRLGLVLSEHGPGRLQPLHPCLEALHKHARRGRDRYDRTGVDGIGLRPGCRVSQPPLAPALSCVIWLNGRKMKHTRGAAFHPQTQGEIERRAMSTPLV